MRLGKTVLNNDKGLDKTFPCLTDKVQLSVQWLGYLKRHGQERPSPKEMLIENIVYCVCHSQPGRSVMFFFHLVIFTDLFHFI